MAEDVNVDSINSFVVKFEMKESAGFLKFIYINNTCRWTKESVMGNIHSLYSGVEEFK